MKNTNILLTVLGGGPVCAFALSLSGAAIYGATDANKWEEKAVLILFSAGFAWALFTGIRNMLRFDRAHFHLAWHDWVGGILGCATNVLLLFAFISLFTDAHFEPPKEWYFILGLSALFISSVASLIFFWIVVFRFWKNRKTKL